MAYLTQRILTPEKMDEPDVPPDRLRKSFRFLRTVNRWLGGSSAVLGHLKRWSRRWKKGQTIRILDIATGCADIPRAIRQWAAAAGHNVRIVGIDLHETALQIAAEAIEGSSGQGTKGSSDRATDGKGNGTFHPPLITGSLDPSIPSPPPITLLRASALSLPFAPNTFDYCITSLFLHHLSDIQVLTVLRMMDRLSTRGLIWNDLTRNRRAYWTTSFATLLADPIVKHDARVSVLAGFTAREVEDIRQRLSLHYAQYRRHFYHRFTLAGEKF
ncbi:MAG: methyltransferase domain-containing protein [Phycisphaeraceae bacterium]